MRSPFSNAGNRVISRDPSPSGFDPSSRPRSTEGGPSETSAPFRRGDPRRSHRWPVPQRPRSLGPPSCRAISEALDVLNRSHPEAGFRPATGMNDHSHGDTRRHADGGRGRDATDPGPPIRGEYSNRGDEEIADRSWDGRRSYGRHPGGEAVRVSRAVAFGGRGLLPQWVTIEGRHPSGGTTPASGALRRPHPSCDPRPPGIAEYFPEKRNGLSRRLPGTWGEILRRIQIGAFKKLQG